MVASPDRSCERTFGMNWQFVAETVQSLMSLLESDAILDTPSVGSACFGCKVTYFNQFVLHKLQYVLFFLSPEKRVFKYIIFTGIAIQVLVMIELVHLRETSRFMVQPLHS